MRKINVFTFLIFAYSIVVCLTCKRDFSHGTVHKAPTTDKIIATKSTGAAVQTNLPIKNIPPVVISKYTNY